ncbi:type I methionyl aminopeptidase [Patescibacteria group bacterium]
MIIIKTLKEIEIMKQGGKILAGVIRELESKAVKNISTKELDNLAENLIMKAGAKPAFKNYNGFPASLCVSINDEIVHGVPSDRKLKQGDIVSLDLGLIYNGFFADMATTIPVGEIDSEAGRLIRVTKKSLKRAIVRSKHGRTIGDIGNGIQNYIEGQGFGVVRNLCGHGIGRNLHEEPEIPNFGQRHKGPKLKNGMVLAIEPMAVVGDWKTKRSVDGFGFKTADGSLSAHFEHTVLVTNQGGIILTK